MDGFVFLAVGMGVCALVLKIVSELSGSSRGSTGDSSRDTDTGRRKSSHDHADTSAADNAQRQADTDAGWHHHHHHHHHDHSSPF